MSVGAAQVVGGPFGERGVDLRVDPQQHRFPVVPDFAFPTACSFVGVVPGG
jgi:hypothetical protein